MINGEQVPGSVYGYAPNKIAAPVFAGAFLILTILHTWQCIHYKAWKITGLHPFCALLFTVGFALRSYGAHDFDQVTIYMVSTICIYCAPPVLELANYHVLGRILCYVPYKAPLHPGRTLTTFGSISFVVEIMNALGVSILASPTDSESRTKLGHILMKASLIIQLGVISIFCIISATFHRRCIKSGVANKKVKGPLYTLYMSMTLIFIRTVYRVVEHFGASVIPRNPPPDWKYSSLSPIIRYEWFFYVFEAALMLINTALWNARHPAHYLPGDYHIYLAQDGQTELLGPGWTTKQSWYMAILDPCGITAMLKERKNKERPFWENNGFENVPLVKDEESSYGNQRNSGYTATSRMDYSNRNSAYTASNVDLNNHNTEYSNETTLNPNTAYNNHTNRYDSAA